MDLALGQRLAMNSEFPRCSRVGTAPSLTLARLHWRHVHSLYSRPVPRCGSPLAASGLVSTSTRAMLSHGYKPEEMKCNALERQCKDWSTARVATSKSASARARYASTANDTRAYMPNKCSTYHQNFGHSFLLNTNLCSFLGPSRSSSVPVVPCTSFDGACGHSTPPIRQEI